LLPSLALLHAVEKVARRASGVTDEERLRQWCDG
jgi:hypothetical protein